MPAFAVPVQAPDGAAILAALDASLSTVPDLDPLLRTALRTYVATLHSPSNVDSSSSIPFAEVVRYGKLESRVKQVLIDNDEPEHYIKRFKRPTGSMAARAGNLLFYPPSSNKDENRGTLVYGPDTTFRMLEAGLSDAGCYTMDLYPFSTKIPRFSPAFKAFNTDESFENEDTAQDLWDLLVADAMSVYATRAITPGLEMVWGHPVGKAYTTATQTLPSSFTWLYSTASVLMPGIANDHGSFEAGNFQFSYQIAYRQVLGSYEFGKVVIRHGHPCKAGVVRSKGGASTQIFWHEALFTDALVRLLFLISRGSTYPRNTIRPSSTFASVATPRPATGDIDFSLYDLSMLRGEEKASGEKFSRADLDARDENIMDIIDRLYDIDENAEQSILFQACSIRSTRANANMSVEAKTQQRYKQKETMGDGRMSAARYKGIKTMGKEGLRAVRKKQDEIMGKEGRSAAASKGLKTKGKEGLKAAASKGLKTKGKEGLQAAYQKGRETLGDAGQRAIQQKIRATNSGGRPCRLGQLADITEIEITAWIKHADTHRNGASSSQFDTMKKKLINNMKDDVLGIGTSAALPRETASFAYWPPLLPYSNKSYTAEELERFGPWVFANKLKAKN